MVNENYKYAALTGKIIGCAMEVHKFLGNRFPSAAKGLPAARQGEMEIGLLIPIL